MTLALLRDVLFWCTVLDYLILLVWFVLFVWAHDGLQRLHGTWFRLSPERFDALHYGGMTVFKVIILVFNLVPYLVLGIVR